MKKLTPGEKIIKQLASEILTKVTRLRNKADLVRQDPAPGRNLTALRNTAAELEELLLEICEPRCRVCGCTQCDYSQCVEKTGKACTWVEADLCSACV